jgi:hypothetical protein
MSRGQLSNAAAKPIPTPKRILAGGEMILVPGPTRADRRLARYGRLLVCNIALTGLNKCRSGKLADRDVNIWNRRADLFMRNADNLVG